MTIIIVRTPVVAKTLTMFVCMLLAQTSEDGKVYLELIEKHGYLPIDVGHGPMFEAVPEENWLDTGCVFKRNIYCHRRRQKMLVSTRADLKWQP